MSKLPYICGTGVIFAIVAVTIFKVPPGNLLFYGILLACPIIHIFMMKDHGSHEDPKHEKKNCH